MKVDTSKKQLVRGYVIYAQWGFPCISMERAKDEKLNFVNVAYTPYHRHDDDPTIVETELERLSNLYGDFNDIDGLMMGFEYKDYSK